jgi:DNA-binding MarR family transcriptional regulator
VSKESELAARLSDVAVRLHRRLRQEEAVHGLTGARLAVLARLHEDGAQSLRALATAEQVTSATMARIVDGLEDGKLVVRRPWHEDGRKVLISTTSLGRSLLIGGRRRHARWIATYFASLTNAQQEVIAQAIDLFSEMLEFGSDSAPRPENAARTDR